MHDVCGQSHWPGGKAGSRGFSQVRAKDCCLGLGW